jgi:ribosomal protein S8E
LLEGSLAVVMMEGQRVTRRKKAEGRQPSIKTVTSIGRIICRVGTRGSKKCLALMARVGKANMQNFSDAIFGSFLLMSDCHDDDPNKNNNNTSNIFTVVNNPEHSNKNFVEKRSHSQEENDSDIA